VTLTPEFARIVFWLCVACCAVAQVAIIYSTLRRLRAGRAGDLRQEEQGRPIAVIRRTPEFIWAVLPAIALILVFAGTWQSIVRVSEAEPEHLPEHPPATVFGSPTLLAAHTLPTWRVHAELNTMSPRLSLPVIVDPPAVESEDPQELHQQ
jgi:hypothetical protein